MKNTYHALGLLLSIFISNQTFAYPTSEIKLESVSGSKQKQGTIRQELSATFDEVWNTVMDIEHYNEFMPKNKSTTVIESTKDKVLYHAVVNMPWPITDVEYDCNMLPRRELQRIDFQMVEGTGLGVKNFYGHWEFEQTAKDKISAKYVLLFEQSQQYPQWVVNMGLKSTLGNVMDHVQKRIDEKNHQSK